MPGWYDDPFGMPQLRYWDGRTWSPYVAPRPLALAHPQRSAGPELDVAVRRMRAENSIAWGWRPVLLPIGAFVAVIVAGPIVTAVIDPKSFNGKVVFTVVANFVVYALLSVVVWFAGRDIAARHGGWGRTFGWRRPKWIDLGYAAAGFAVTLFARIVVGVVANAFTHGKASSEAQNLDLHSVTIAAVVLLVVITVVCAPVIEELVFRGLLLRTFMRRLGFWPAAVLSTLIFALFHTYEVDTIAGAITLALSVACLGLANCVLNRYTDRLAAGIGVHASSNLLALVIVVAQAGR